MAEQPDPESPYDPHHEAAAAAPTITAPTEGEEITTETFAIKGTAPAGSTVYYMEDMGGEELWQHIEVVAEVDGTFVIDQLSNGTGVGDNVTHIVFVNVGGKVEGLKVTGGTNSKKVKFTYRPKKE